MVTFVDWLIGQVKNICLFATYNKAVCLICIFIFEKTKPKLISYKNNFYLMFVCFVVILSVILRHCCSYYLLCTIISKYNADLK